MMIRAERAATLVVYLVMLSAQALAAEGPDAFARRVDLAITPGGAFYRVELPLAVHAGVTRPDLADLRVFNGAGEPVPFAFASGGEALAVAAPELPLPLFPLHAVKSDRTVGGLDLRIEQKSDGTLISVNTGGKADPQSALLGYLLDASLNQRPLNRLTLAWPPSDTGVNTRVNVEASEDLKSWRMVISGAPMLELSFGGQRLKQQSIELDRLKARYLRLSFAIASIELLSVKATLAPDSPELARRNVTLPGQAVAGAPLDYRFDAGASLSIDRVAFDLPQVNTVAPAELLARDREGDPWRTITNTVLYRLAGEGGEVKSPALAISTTTARQWLLRLSPASGGLGGGSPQMLGGYLPRHLVFVARGAAPFSIAYGRQARPGEKEAPAAVLQLASLMPDYKPGAEWRLPEARPGAPVVVNPAAAAPGIVERIDTRTLGLWSILLVAVLLLAVMAWRLVKQGDKGG